MSRRCSLFTTIGLAAVFAVAAGHAAAATSPPSVGEASAASSEHQAASAGSELVRRQIAIDDPDLGPLTFDALAAGDPAGAAEGRLVLLLHGFPQSPESFRKILPALADAGYYAVAPALRGYSPGARPSAVSAYAIPSHVGDVVRMMYALGASRFHGVGHDWGGAVAWGLATVLPQHVASLTAISTPHPDAMKSAYFDPSTRQKQMLAYMGIFRTPGIEYLMTSAGPGPMTLSLQLMGVPAATARSYATALRRPQDLARALNWYRANPVPAEIDLGPVPAPTQLIVGGKEFAFSKAAIQRTADYVTGPYRLTTLPSIGHFVPDAAPREVTRLFLEQAAAVESGSPSSAVVR